jgi:UDP-2-acetamido-2,6-beta-L-arabino-hexul-4-ose reductase
MKAEMLAIAVTGAEGFIGRNLTVRLGEAGMGVLPIARGTPAEAARAALMQADIVFHLAGANRPEHPRDFLRDNRDYTAWVAEAIAEGGKCPLVVYASSIGADDDSDYGRSKCAGEDILLETAERGAATVAIFRLPNVFGKWARPDYNSAVATFCHNLARGLPIRIDDPAAPIALLYIDDLIDQWCGLIDTPPATSGFVKVAGVYHTIVGEVAERLRAFADTRAAGHVGVVGIGLSRALYATFVAALPEDRFTYPLAAHVDARGSFTEMIKTLSSGQVSVLTCNPGATRGGHYHHSKVEKFLVVHGSARFRFRHIVSGAEHEVDTCADRPVVVETIPGWTHDITNIGEGPMVSLIWANEVFDRERPDTVAMPL